MIERCAQSALPIGVRGRGYLTSLNGSLSSAYSGVNHFFTVRDRRDMLGTAFSADARPEMARAAACDAAQGVPGLAMIGDFNTYLCDDILVKVDRASMLSSLEVRAPWLSRDIIEFAYQSVPNHLRVDHGSSKIIVKTLAKRLLPAQLNMERKQGFAIPIDAWIAGSWGEYMEDVLRSAPAWLLSPKAVTELFAGQRRGRNNGQRLFALTMLELWRRAYGMQP